MSVDLDLNGLGRAMDSTERRYFKKKSGKKGKKRTGGGALAWHGWRFCVSVVGLVLNE